MQNVGVMPTLKSAQSISKVHALRTTLYQQFDLVSKERLHRLDSDNMAPFLNEAVKNFLLELSVDQIETMAQHLVHGFLEQYERPAEPEPVDDDEKYKKIAQIKRPATARTENPRAKTDMGLVAPVDYDQKNKERLKLI